MNRNITVASIVDVIKSSLMPRAIDGPIAGCLLQMSDS